MRMVVQRVSSASVTINEQQHSAIGKGLLVFLGIEHGDSDNDIDWLCRKIVSMRIFSDTEGKMNLDVMQASGEVMLISQFTLHASTKKGNRPSFIRAAPPSESQPLYNTCLIRLSELLKAQCKSGQFGADMKIALVNDGPVTIIIDSRQPE
jgi:D-tyrosyl-tRNA(Tyr) deacylase